MSKQYTLQEIRDISVEVYKIRLGKKDAERMLAKDRDNGQKLRSRAESYDVLTKCYITALQCGKI